MLQNCLRRGTLLPYFRGESEFGPRALGYRSILADPRRASMKRTLNTKVKFREQLQDHFSAPSVLCETASEYFCLDRESPFMLLAVKVRKSKVCKIPAVVHVDGTSRVQTVSKKENGVYYEIIKRFKNLTGVPVLLNTSFNLGGEPMVESPEDAIKCFLSTDIDYLLMNDILISKRAA